MKKQTGNADLGALLAALALAVLMVAISWAGKNDREEAQHQQGLYCEMVQAWDESGGEYGWPPYNGREQCDARR